MNIKKTIESDLKEVFSKFGFDTSLASVVFSGREGCDFQCNSAFSLAKQLKKNPFQVATDIANNIQTKSLYDEAL